MNLALRLLSLAPAAALAASASAQFSQPLMAFTTASGPPVCSVTTPTGIVVFRVDGLGTSGANVAMGDVNDDGFDDIIVGAGPGAPGGHVKVFSGQGGGLLLQLAPFGNGYTGATYVAAGTLRIGSTRVHVFLCASDHRPVDSAPIRLIDARSGAVVGSLDPFPGFAGGVRVATADLDGDGLDEIIAAPHHVQPNLTVKVFSGQTGLEIQSVTIAGNIPPGGSGDDVLIGGLGADVLNGHHSGGILVCMGDGSVRLIVGEDQGVWYPFGPSYAGGISVATGDVNGDGRAEVIAGTLAGGTVTFIDTATGQPVGAMLQPFGPGFLGGINVAAAPARRCPGADFDGDGDIGTDADIEAFFACLAGSCCSSCLPNGADFNRDGDIGTDADIEAFFRVLAGGSC